MESGFCAKIKLTSYPCVERGGIIWTYMGPPEHKPPLPELEWATLPADHRFMTELGGQMQKTFSRASGLSQVRPQVRKMPNDSKVATNKGDLPS